MRPKSVGIQCVVSKDRVPEFIVMNYSARGAGVDVPFIVYPTDPHAQALLDEVVKDGRLGASLGDLIACQCTNSSLIAKTMLPRMAPWDYTVYLDVDMLICTELRGLLQPSYDLAVTQLHNLTTQNAQIRHAICQWAEFAPTRVAKALASTYAAINTGVFAYSKRGALQLQEWNHFATLGAHLPATDEIALQLMLPELIATVLPGSVFNYCVGYPDKLEDAEALHFHGGRNRRGAGQAIWHAFEQCAFTENWGSISSFCETRV